MVPFRGFLGDIIIRVPFPIVNYLKKPFLKTFPKKGLFVNCLVGTQKISLKVWREDFFLRKVSFLGPLKGFGSYPGRKDGSPKEGV